MKRNRIILFSTLLLMGTGCASMKDSVWTGVGAGAAIGAGAGTASNHRDRGKGAAVGALVGAAVGALSGHFIHKGLETRDDDTRKETLFNIDKFGVSGAQGGFSSTGDHGLTMPKIDSEWVPTTVQGKKLIEGHRVWLISEDPQWVPGKDEDKGSD